jgi:hypothetical protein
MQAASELVGVGTIVASLVFVGMQLQQDRELAQVSTYGSVVESANALAELVQAHSDVWVRGLNGEELTPAELAIFRSMVRAVVDRYVNFNIRWTAYANPRLVPEEHFRNFAQPRIDSNWPKVDFLEWSSVIFSLRSALC